MLSNVNMESAAEVTHGAALVDAHRPNTSFWFKGREKFLEINETWTNSKEGSNRQTHNQCDPQIVKTIFFLSCFYSNRVIREQHYYKCQSVMGLEGPLG